LPVTGIETFAFLLLVDKLFDLRPSFKETLGDKVQIRKDAKEAKFKSLSDEDVWYSHIEILEE
jgi:hypothetical protein